MISQRLYLIKTAEWLINKGKLKKSDCPLGTKGSSYIINYEAKHKNGNDFRAPHPLSNGLFLEKHGSSQACKSNARRLLKKFGYAEDMLVIKE